MSSELLGRSGVARFLVADVDADRAVWVNMRTRSASKVVSVASAMAMGGRASRPLLGLPVEVDALEIGTALLVERPPSFVASVAARMSAAVKNQQRCPKGISSGGQFTGPFADNCAPTPAEVASMIGKLDAGTKTLADANPAELQALADGDSPYSAEARRRIEGLTDEEKTFIPGPETGNPEGVTALDDTGISDFKEWINVNGGFTYDPATGGVEFTGFQVAGLGVEAIFTDENFTVANVRAVIDEIEAAGIDGAQIGGWRDEDGLFYIEASQNLDTLAEAGQAMMDRGEKAIWSHDDFIEIWNPNLPGSIDQVLDREGVVFVFDPETGTSRPVRRDRSATIGGSSDDGPEVT